MLSPREILGDNVVEQIREAICKLGVKPEHIYEIVLDVEKAVSTVESYAKKISPSELPCILYFITHLYRPDNSHEVSLIRHEMEINGENKTGFEYSLFSFQYRIVDKIPNTPARFRFDYIKAREDLRSLLIKPSIIQIIQFAKKNYPGFKVEMRSDNLIAGYMASKILEEPRFMKISDDHTCQIGHIIHSELIVVLEKIGILSLSQAKDLRALISQVIKPEEKNAHYINIHDKLLEYIHDNFSTSDTSYTNEVSFFFNQLMKSPEGSQLVSKSPYQGDLWIEGRQPS